MARWEPDQSLHSNPWQCRCFVCSQAVLEISVFRMYRSILSTSTVATTAVHASQSEMQLTLQTIDKDVICIRVTNYIVILILIHSVNGRYDDGKGNWMKLVLFLCIRKVPNGPAQPR